MDLERWAKTWNGTIRDIKKGTNPKSVVTGYKTNTYMVEGRGDPHFVGPEADHIWGPYLRERINI